MDMIVVLQSERDLRERELRERDIRERMPKQQMEAGLKMFTDPATAAAVMEQQHNMAAAAQAHAQALMPGVHPSVVQGLVTQQAIEQMRQQQPYAGNSSYIV